MDDQLEPGRIPTPKGVTFGEPAPPTQQPAPSPGGPADTSPATTPLATGHIATPPGVTYGESSGVQKSAADVPNPNFFAPAPHVIRRTAEGVGESLKGAASSLVAVPKMILAPPTDSTEALLTSTIGPGGLSAYRLGKQIVDATQQMLKAKPEEFQESVKTLKQLTDEFHNHDYRNALASAIELGGHVTAGLHLFPGAEDIGQREAAIGAGTRPGGNLAGPLAKLGTDAALMYLGEKVPDIAEAAAAKLDKYAPKVANGLLRATKQTDFLYDKNPGEALLDPRIRPAGLESLFEQLDDIGADYSARMDAAMRDPRIAGRMTDVAPAINNIINDALTDIQNSRMFPNREALVDRIKNIRDEMLGTFDKDGKLLGIANHTNLAPADLLEMRRGMGRSISWDAFEKDPAIRDYVNNVQKKIYSRLNNRIETIAQRGGLEDIKELNKGWAQNIEARRLIARRIATEEKNDVGLRRLLSKSELYGGIKLIASGEPVTGGLLVANRIMRTPFSRVAKAQLANSLGETIVSNKPAIGMTPAAAYATVIASQQRRKEEQENPPAKPTGALSQP